jgi:hypothetical protein
VTPIRLNLRLLISCNSWRAIQNLLPFRKRGSVGSLASDSPQPNWLQAALSKACADWRNPEKPRAEALRSRHKVPGDWRLGSPICAVRR